ncbi:hypothetical protein Tco_0195461 [Tanacetum coccineum]
MDFVVFQSESRVGGLLGFLNQSSFEAASTLGLSSVLPKFLPLLQWISVLMFNHEPLDGLASLLVFCFFNPWSDPAGGSSSLTLSSQSSVIWERVHDFQLGIESYQQKVNLTAPTITFPGIEEHDMFSIIYEPVHGIIYKNSKKEKRVMRHTEIHKFCDATLNRVLEGLKSYNNDVKYGYVQKDLTKDETEYLKLFEEEIEERLKHRRQMRRWEMYVNGRPLGLRRERPE